jgi:hypothetical protein
VLGASLAASLLARPAPADPSVLQPGLQ